MKKKMFASITLGVMVFVQSATSALALMPTQMPLRMQQRQEIRQERRDTVLENIANRVEARFNRHEERLQNWIDRAAGHISNRESKGKDMSAAKKALDKARTSLTTASQLGDDAVAKLRAVTPENWQSQKEDALAAREAVKKAQVAYVQVVKDMRLSLQEMKKAQ